MVTGWWLTSEWNLKSKNFSTVILNGRHCSLPRVNLSERCEAHRSISLIFGKLFKWSIRKIKLRVPVETQLLCFQWSIEERRDRNFYLLHEWEWIIKWSKNIITKWHDWLDSINRPIPNWMRDKEEKQLILSILQQEYFKPNREGI